MSSDSITTALIDADILAYSIGFSVDHTYYKIGGEKFKYKKQATDFCKMCGADPSTIEKVHKAGKFDNAVKKIDEFIEAIKTATLATDTKLFLTGSNNFRKEIATTAKYKGTRDASKRPHHMDAIRSYLVEEKGAIITDGYEADDALGIHQNLTSTVICSTDKDLLTIPGWNFNWNKQDLYYVSEWEASLHFWRQMLTGDRSDNIIGVYKDTPYQIKRAESELSKLPSLDAAKCYVGMKYAVAFDNPESRMLENGKLLYILRSEDDEWTI